MLNEGVQFAEAAWVEQQVEALAGGTAPTVVLALDALGPAPLPAFLAHGTQPRELVLDRHGFPLSRLARIHAAKSERHYTMQNAAR